MGAVLLAGTVGSTAYGLAHAGSDVDTRGIFAVPTIQLHGLGRPAETVQGVTARSMLGYGDKDVELHEAAKWCRLALAGNPTVLELVWLPANLYTTLTPLGQELIDIRHTFLSANRVRNAYLGYARAQFDRLRNRGGTFSADTARRTAKHARHLARLITQGQALYVSGTMSLKVSNPDWYFQFGEEVARGELGRAEAYLTAAGRFFDEARSVLPDRPDDGPANDWLFRVRSHYYDQGRVA